MAEKFLSTMLLMFISLCYFIYNACRDTAAEKEFDIVIQMTLEHVLVQRFKKKEIEKKKLLTKMKLFSENSYRLSVLNYFRK